MIFTLNEDLEEDKSEYGKAVMYHDLIKAYYDMVDRVTSVIVTSRDLGDESTVPMFQDQIQKLDDMIDEVKSLLDAIDVFDDSFTSAAMTGFRLIRPYDRVNHPRS